MLNDQLPAIFAQTPEQIVTSTTIAQFPVNTFLENIAIDAQGNLFVTSYEEGKVYQITIAGDVQEFAKVEGNMAGVVVDPQGNLLVTGAIDKTQVVFQIDRDGHVQTLVTLPDAGFLNGMTPLTSDRYLIADSIQGAVWEVDAIAKTSRLWIQHEGLAPPEANSAAFFPAANGIKTYANMLYVSNTKRQHLIRIPISSDYSPGTPEIFLANVNLDDFAFDVQGNLYATTHIYNSVVKISPDGHVTTIATAEQGMAGSTALAFGRTESDRTSLYVTTNGGMSLPLSHGVEPGKVVRLEVGTRGLELGE